MYLFTFYGNCHIFFTVYRL